jgi:thiol-disulfide isomerase/thioredoxin
MKKFISIIVFMLTVIFVITGCSKSSLDFKKEYESVNGKTLRGDIKYRSLNISKNNPYIKTTIEDIESKINNNESFYLYVGDSLCPWCRSGLEKMIEVAKKEKVKKIYYVDFWDDDHNEILRDLYDVEEKDGVISVVKIKDGLSGYNTLLNAVSDFVQDYTLTKDGKEYETGVKRIYGGDHFYFDNGKCVKYVSLRSDKLSNANDELTDEVLEDQENKFTHFLTSNSSQ